jgi:hypothetical protein
VPSNCSISFVASLAWDTGNLGGDSAPSNTGGVQLPTVNNVKTLVVDANADGYPDLPDRTAPTLVSAVANADTVVAVTFSERLEAVSAQSPANYSIYETNNPTSTVSVLAATLGADGKTVTLKTGMQALVQYTLSVSGVRDSACARNVIATNSTVQFAGLTAVGEGSLDESTVAERLMLRAAVPNPSRSSTRLLFRAPRGSATLTLFDAAGRVVRVYRFVAYAGGNGSVVWDGRDESGRSVAAGVYVARLTAGGRGTSQLRFVRMP